MKLKLQRDDLRLLHLNFFPYLDLLTQNKVAEKARQADEWLNTLVVRSVFLDVKLKVDKKLLSTAVSINLKLNQAEGITLYKLLLTMPISESQVYAGHLRQSICNSLHNQIMSLC